LGTTILGNHQIPPENVCLGEVLGGQDISAQEKKTGVRISSQSFGRFSSGFQICRKIIISFQKNIEICGNTAPFPLGRWLIYLVGACYDEQNQQ